MTPPTLESEPSFRDWFPVATSSTQQQVTRTQHVRTWTQSVVDMPLPEFLRIASDKFGAGVIASAELDSQLVTAEFVTATAEDVFGTVARRLGVQATLRGGTWYVGELLPEDRAWLVRRVPRVDAQGLSGAVTTLLSQFGRAQTYPDGVVVVADRVDVLRRVQAMLDALAAVEGEAWCVQLHLVSQSASTVGAYGMQGLPQIEFAAALSAGLNPEIDIAQAVLGWTGLLSWSWTTRGVSVVASPMFIVSPGTPARLSDGQELRLPTRTVTDQGTVTTTGFQIVDTGLGVDVLLQDLSSDTARMRVDISLAELAGNSGDGLPIITRQKLSVTPTVRTGGVYLIGSLERTNGRVGRGAPFIRTDDDETRTIQVWARVVRAR